MKASFIYGPCICQVRGQTLYVDLTESFSSQRSSDVMLSLILAPLFLHAVLGAQPTAAPDPVEIFHQHVAQSVNALWTDLDYNKNGRYDRSDLGQLIIDYDSNGDMEVTKEEFVYHFDMDEPTLAILAEALFLEYDDNQDGFFDNKDLDAVYNRIDQNDDGQVDRLEFNAYYTQLLTILFILQTQHIE